MLDIEYYLVGASLVSLTVLLAVLSVRGFLQFRRGHVRSQLMWASGLTCAAAAMLIEAVVFAGVVSSILLQSYVFLSAAIVGVLSLGATRILQRPRVEAAYTAYVLVSSGLVAVMCAVTPLPTSMVSAGIISGNPPVLLLVLSSLVTGPATVLLLTASYLSLRRSWRWQTLLMVAGAVILGAGGTLYIASFPVALYYAEFLGILILFLGLISMPQASASHAPMGAPTASP
ncbi:MAG: hypothetical protein L3J96_03090 [Thermoplasmata archaeon]|nr:hypothetical protein [Thermoplasmata archaeon]